MRQYFKLAIKKKTFMIIPVLMLLITVFLYMYPKRNNTGIIAGFYVEMNDDSNACFDLFINNLITYEGNVSFVRYNSLQSLKDAVIRCDIECGYHLSSDLIDNMDNGKYRNKIKVYKNHLTTMDNVINQALFSCLFQEYAYHQLIMYADNAAELSHINKIEIDTALNDSYQKYTTTDATFSFSFSGNQTYEIHAKSIFSFPFIGILAIMAMLASFSGYVSFLNYREKHCFDKIIYRHKKINMIKFITPYIIIPCITFTLCSIILYKKVFMHLLLNILIFIIILYALYFIIYTLKISRKPVLALLPAYITLCLVFSPIIIDITDYLKFLKPVKYLIITNLFY